jgi:hypothetical protein
MCSHLEQRIHKPSGISLRGFNENPFHFDFGLDAIGGSSIV